MYRTRFITASIAALFSAFFICSCAGIRTSESTETGAESLHQYPAKDSLVAESFQQLQDRSDIGKLLANQDAVAWIATDSVMAILPENSLGLIAGWVAQGSVSDGYAVFYEKRNDSYYQIVRVNFKNGVLEKSLAHEELEGGIRDLVAANDSAYNFFMQSGEPLDIKYNSYILKNEDGYTFYAMPGSTNEYLVYGGAYKLTADASLDWNLQKMHKSPIAIEYSQLSRGDYFVRSSSMEKLLNEADFAQAFITSGWAKKQYVSTSDYMFLLNFDSQKNMNVMLVK